MDAIDELIAKRSKGHRKRSLLLEDTPEDKSVASTFSAAGQTPPEQPGPGLGRRIVDLISRPLYATTAIGEELFSPVGSGDPLKAGERATTELLSGLPGFQGQKIDPSQALERAGVGKMGSLSDLVPSAFNETGEGPQLQRGGWADLTGRGTVGLAASVVIDPLSYLSFGASTGLRVGLKSGVKYLSPEGVTAWKTIQEGLEPAYKLAAESEQGVLRRGAAVQIRDHARDLLEKEITANPKLLEPGGIKWFRHQIVSPDTLRQVSDPIKDMALRVPGVDKATKQAVAVVRGFKRAFDPWGALEGLPAGVREEAIRIARDYADNVSNLKAELFAPLEGVVVEYKKLAKSYGKDGGEALGARFAKWRQGTEKIQLTPEEASVFSKIAGLYDAGEKLGVSEGVVDVAQAEKRAGKYLHQGWQNTEDLAQYHAGVSGAQQSYVEKFQKARQFETYEDGIAFSKAENQKTREWAAALPGQPIYPVLVPKYDAADSLGSYLQQLTDAVAHKRYIEEMRGRFGLDIPIGDASKVYELDRVAQLPTQERQTIENFLGESKTLKGVQEEMIDASGTPEAWSALAHAANQTLPKLSIDGRRELVRELVSRANSPGQIVRLIRDIPDFENLMPKLRNAVNEGDVEPFFTQKGFSQDAGQIVIRGGGLWGDTPVKLPKAVVDLVEQAPHDIWAGAFDKTAGKDLWRAVVKGYDKYSNLFKAMTYPGYPSGAVRDAYNNVMHSYLYAGAGAFARPGMAFKVLRGADSEIELAGRVYKASELKRTFAEVGITDPTAASFVQFTGEGKVKQTGLLAKARIARGSVDNWTRTQLALNAMAQGMDVRDAADIVRRFHYAYNELSPIDRDIMKRIVPFWVFTRKTIGLYGELLTERPGRLANLSKPFTGRDEENKQMTTWEGEGYKLRLERDGNRLTMLNGIDLPIRTLDTLWDGSLKRTMQNFLAMTAPPIKLGVMKAFDTDPFTGRQLGRMDAPTLGRVIEHMGPTVKAWTGWTKDQDAAGRPKYTVREDKVKVLQEALLISRIFSTSDRQFREWARDPGYAARALDFMTGLRFKTLNLDDEMKQRAIEREKFLKSEAVNQGLLRESSYTFKPKAASR